MTINDCYTLLKYRADKAGYNNVITPNDFNLIWGQAELAFFNKFYSLYAQNQRVSDAISKWLSDPIVLTLDATGRYNLPADFLHVDSLYNNYNNNLYSVDRVEKDHLSSILTSEYEAPSLEFPIYTEYSTWLQFYPINITPTLIYLKKPTPSFWGYTLTNGRPVYNSATSVQPLWSDLDISEIVNMALRDFALNTKDDNLEQFAQNEVNTKI